MTESEENKDNQKESQEKNNSVFIGNKPIMSYVTNTVIQLKNNPQEISIKARGKFISKAVDVAEVVRNRFLKEIKPKIKNIKIDTEEYQKEGKPIKISTIDITIGRTN